MTDIAELRERDREIARLTAMIERRPPVYEPPNVTPYTGGDPNIQVYFDGGNA